MILLQARPHLLGARPQHRSEVVCYEDGRVGFATSFVDAKGGETELTNDVLKVRNTDEVLVIVGANTDFGKAAAVTLGRLPRTIEHSFMP